MLPLSLSAACAPVQLWTTCPRKNGWVAPQFEDDVHDDMAAIALHRLKSGLPVSAAAPGCYFVVLTPAPSDEAIPDGYRLRFLADGGSHLLQHLVLNEGRARLITDPTNTEAQPLWMRAGQVYAITFDRSRDAWLYHSDSKGPLDDAR